MVAEACNVTAKAGPSHTKGFEDAVNSRISGELQEVESNFPDDLRDDALRVFRYAVSQKSTIRDAIKQVQEEALSEVENIFKGQRFKGYIKFDYDSNVIQINVNKFGNGNAQFSAGVGVKRMVCPDPFMGRLSDPNIHR